MDLKEFGQTLKSARKQAGLTMKEAGVAAGVVYQNIDHYEAGRREIPLSNLELLATAYGLRLNLSLNDPEKMAVYLPEETAKIIKNLESLPSHHRDLVIRLLDLAQNAPVSALRASIAMMESLAETDSQVASTPRQAG